MSSVYIEREERESIDRASEDSVFRFVEPSLNPGAACARKRIRRAPPRFSHCLPSICRFKYICSHLSGPFPDNLYAKRIEVKEAVPIFCALLVTHFRSREEESWRLSFRDDDFSRYILEFFVLNFIFAIHSDNSDNSLFEKLILDLWRYILEFFVLNFIFAIRSDNSLFEKLILNFWKYIFEFLIIELSDNSIFEKFE